MIRRVFVTGLIIVLCVLVLGYYSPSAFFPGFDFGGHPWVVSAEDFLELNNDNDAASYLKYSNWWKGGGFDRGLMNFWTPLFPLWVFTATWVWSGKYYYFSLLVQTVVLWAFAISLWTRDVVGFSVKRQAVALALLIPGAYFLELQVVRISFFGGVFLSESASMAICMISMWALVQFAEKKRIIYSIYFGICLALLSYLRAYLDLPIIATLLMGFISISLLKRFSSQMHGSEANLSKLFLGLCVSILIYFAATLPWRIRTYLVEGHMNMSGGSLFQAKHYYWSKDLPDWVRTGNTACKVSPEVCDEIAKDPTRYAAQDLRKLAVKAFVSNPFKWINLKVSEVDWLLFGESFQSLRHHPLGFLGGFLLVIAYVYSAFRTLRRREVGNLVLFLFVTVLGLMHLPVFAFSHFENRYVFPFQTFVFLLALYCLRSGPLGPRRI